MPLRAIVQTGGKQYWVKADDVLDVEKLGAEAGTEVTLEDVRLLESEGQVTVDRQALAGARVLAHVEEDVKGPKVVIGKYKAKTHYRRKTGHRQQYTRLRIKEVVAG